MVAHTFSAGSHTVEVEYENNWHTTEFYVRFLDPISGLEVAQLQKKLSGAFKKQPVILFGGIYESESFNGATSVTLAHTTAPVVLILASYSSVQWNVEEAYKGQLLAVIVSSYASGSHVLTQPAGAKVLHANRSDFPAFYRIIPHCEDIQYPDGSDYFYCASDPNNFLTLASSIEAISNGQRLDGFSGTYAAATLTLPTTYFSTNRYNEIVAELTDLVARDGR